MSEWSLAAGCLQTTGLAHSFASRLNYLIQHRSFSFLAMCVAQFRTGEKNNIYELVSCHQLPYITHPK